MYKACTSQVSVKSGKRWATGKTLSAEGLPHIYGNVPVIDVKRSKRKCNTIHYQEIQDMGGAGNRRMVARKTHAEYDLKGGISHKEFRRELTKADKHNAYGEYLPRGM